MVIGNGDGPGDQLKKGKVLVAGANKETQRNAHQLLVTFIVVILVFEEYHQLGDELVHHQLSEIPVLLQKDKKLFNVVSVGG